MLPMNEEDQMSNEKKTLGQINSDATLGTLRGNVQTMNWELGAQAVIKEWQRRNGEPVAIVKHIDGCGLDGSRAGVYVHLYNTVLPDGAELYTIQQPAQVAQGEPAFFRDPETGDTCGSRSEVYCQACYLGPQPAQLPSVKEL